MTSLFFPEILEVMEENQPVQEVSNQTPVEQPVAEPEKTSILNSPDDSFQSGSRTNGIRRGKWLKIGGILVFLLVLLGAVFVAGSKLTKKPQAPAPAPAPATTNPTPSPTSAPDLTANWKTYNGNGFSFKYPSDWTQGSVDASTGETSINPPPDTACPHCAGGFAGLSISLLSNPSSMSLSEYMKSNSDKFGGSYYLKDYKKYSIPGSIDAFIDRNALGAGAVQEEAVINGNKLVVILYCGSSLCTDNNLFDQILSTFKFTSSTVANPTSNSTSNWKTYTNTKYGYSFKYPSEFSLSNAGENANNTDASVLINPYLSSFMGAPGLPILWFDVLPLSGNTSSLTYNNDGFTRNVNEYLTTKFGDVISPSNQPWNAKFTRLTDQKIDNETFLVFEDNGEGKPQGMKDKRLILKTSQYIYILGIYTNQKDSEVNQVLSTFKFTQ